MSHATHEMHPNSVATYYDEEARLSRRASAVLAWVSRHGKHTDREIAAGMGFAHRSAVQPRVSELVKDGILLEVGTVICPETGRPVRLVDVPRKPEQRALFSP